MRFRESVCVIAALVVSSAVAAIAQSGTGGSAPPPVFAQVTNGGATQPARPPIAGAPAPLTYPPSSSSSAPSGNVIIPAKDPSGRTIGQIDWTQQEITAEGSGVPPANTTGPQGKLMACRAAEVESRRNLLETIQGMQVDSETTVVNYVTQNDTIRTRLQGLVQATTMEKQVDADGTCTVRVRLGIHATGGKPSVAAIVSPAIPTSPPPTGGVVGAKPPAPGAVVPPVPPSQPTAPPLTPPPAPGTGIGEVAKTQPGGPVYTGIVVDARGAGARPAMSPKILDDGGEPLYGSAYVSRDYAIEHGLAGYSKNMDAATRNARVTDNPLLVKASSASGSAKADLVLSKDDALRLRTAAQSQSFLAQARVMIVLD